MYAIKYFSIHVVATNTNAVYFGGGERSERRERESERGEEKKQLYILL